MFEELYHNMKPFGSLLPNVYTTSTEGDAADLQGYNTIAALIDVGIRTDGTHEFELKDSEDNLSFEAVADDFLIGEEPLISGSAQASQSYLVSYIGGKRYLRVDVDITGGSTGAKYSANILRYLPHRGPVE